MINGRVGGVGGEYCGGTLEQGTTESPNADFRLWDELATHSGPYWDRLQHPPLQQDQY